MSVRRGVVGLRVATGDSMTDIPDCYRPVGEPPPEGWILAHNNVRPHLGRRKGGLGFRAFWVPWGSKWEVCHCGWRPDLGEHHREREEM